MVVQRVFSGCMYLIDKRNLNQEALYAWCITKNPILFEHLSKLRYSSTAISSHIIMKNAMSYDVSEFEKTVGYLT